MWSHVLPNTLLSGAHSQPLSAVCSMRSCARDGGTHFDVARGQNWVQAVVLESI